MTNASYEVLFGSVTYSVFGTPDFYVNCKYLVSATNLTTTPKKIDYSLGYRYLCNFYFMYIYTLISNDSWLSRDQWLNNMLISAKVLC